MEKQELKEMGLTAQTAEALQLFSDGVILTQRIEGFLSENGGEWNINPSQTNTALLDMLREIVGRCIEKTLFEFLPYDSPDDAII